MGRGRIRATRDQGAKVWLTRTLMRNPSRGKRLVHVLCPEKMRRNYQINVVSFPCPGFLLSEFKNSRV